MTEAIHQTLLLHPVLGLLLVGAIAWLEYVFPPAPGDSVMLLACFLAGTGSLPRTGTIAACLLGSVLGSFTAYWFGLRLGHSYFFLRSSWARHELERLERGFARFGARLLAVNRFLPGIRGVFLYAAGIAREPFGEVALYATLSNVLWVMLIAWAGTSLGSSWEDVERVFRRYVWVIGIGTGIYVAVSIARARRRRRLNPSSSSR